MKNKKELLGYIIILSLILGLTVMALLGFSELIEDTSSKVIAFYGLIMISLLNYLGGLISEPFDYIIGYIKGK